MILKTRIILIKKIFLSVFDSKKIIRRVFGKSKENQKEKGYLRGEKFLCKITINLQTRIILN